LRCAAQATELELSGSVQRYFEKTHGGGKPPAAGAW